MESAVGELLLVYSMYILRQEERDMNVTLCFTFRLQWGFTKTCCNTVYYIYITHSVWLLLPMFLFMSR